MFNQLRSFYNEYGHCNVTKDHCPSLHAWVKKQRWLYSKLQRAHHMSATITERLQLLEASVDFSSYARYREKKKKASPCKQKDRVWKASFEELQRHQIKFPNGSFPPALTEWLNRQLHQYIQAQVGKEMNGLRKERMNILENLPNFSACLHQYYQTLVDRLCQYKSIHGKRPTFADNADLAKLLTLLRRSHEIGKLNADFTSILFQKGLFSVPRKPKQSKKKEPTWEEMFQEYKASYEASEENIFLFLSHLPSSHPNLHTWIVEQRHRYMCIQRGIPSDILTPERIKALQNLNFIWDVENITWDLRLQELRRFKEENGHCHVPLWYPSNPELGSWVHMQHRQMELYQSGEGKLDEMRMGLLKEVGLIES